jgi:hypothetical protein
VSVSADLEESRPAHVARPLAHRAAAGARRLARRPRLAVADGVITPELEQVVAPIGGELARVLRSSPYADAAADPETVTDLAVFGSFEGIESHATIVDGRWAEPGASPLEATLSEAAAGVLGVATGDRLSFVGRLEATRRVEVVITGTWRTDLEASARGTGPTSSPAASSSGWRSRGRWPTPPRLLLADEPTASWTRRQDGGSCCSSGPWCGPRA